MTSAADVNASICINVTPSSVDPRMERIKSTVRECYFYSMGVIIPTGLVCNAFCIIVCAVSHGLRRTTTGHYLMALAVADLLFLVGDLIRWMNTSEPSGEYRLSLDFMHTNDAACKLSYYLRYSSKLVSAWVTVTIVVERLIIVALPLKVSLVSTTRRAKIVILAIVVIGLSLGSYPLFTIGVERSKHSGLMKCLIKERRRPLYTGMNTAILMCGTLAIPAVIITAITGVIVVMLTRASRRRQSMQMDGQLQRSQHRASASMSAFTPSNQRVDVISRSPDLRSASLSGATNTCKVGQPRGPPERQLTLMLVSVSVAFICLRLPYTISFALYEYGKDIAPCRSSAVELRYLLAKNITDVIATTNYVVNFFLYGLCGSYFRQQVRAAFRCRRGGHGGWVSGRQRPYRSGSHLSNRTSVTARVSLTSESMHLAGYRLHDHEDDDHTLSHSWPF